MSFFLFLEKKKTLAAWINLPLLSPLTELCYLTFTSSWHLTGEWRICGGKLSSSGNARESQLTSAVFTWISEHEYYPVHMHTHTYLATVHTHRRSHTTRSHIHKSITWLASTLMMLLTLMRKGARSWRQLTMLIMEISHWCLHNKPSCQRMTHWLTWIRHVLYMYACGAFHDPTPVRHSQETPE